MLRNEECYEKWVKIGKAVRGGEEVGAERRETRKAKKSKRNTNENSFTYKHNDGGGDDAVNKEHL